MLLTEFSDTFVPKNSFRMWRNSIMFVIDFLWIDIDLNRVDYRVREICRLFVPDRLHVRSSAATSRPLHCSRTCGVIITSTHFRFYSRTYRSPLRLRINSPPPRVFRTVASGLRRSELSQWRRALA